jgi:hypothetical protein
MELDLKSLSKSELDFLEKTDRALVRTLGPGTGLSDEEKRRVCLEREASWARASGSIMTLFLSLATIILAMLAILFAADRPTLSESLFVMGTWMAICALSAGAWLLAAPRSSKSYAAQMASFILDQRELVAVREVTVKGVPCSRRWSEILRVGRH